VGMSNDEAQYRLTDAAKNTLINVLGVDLTSLAYRGKFVFAGQVGSPQKAAYELRDALPPGGIGMDVLITGLSLNSKQVRYSNNCLEICIKVILSDCPHIHRVRIKKRPVAFLL